MQTLIQKCKLERFITLPEVRQDDLEKHLQPIEESLEFGIESRAKEGAAATRLQSVYPIIDPSFLRMKHNRRYNGACRYTLLSGQFAYSLSLPRFAIYSLDSPTCELDINLCFRVNSQESVYINSFNVFPELPPLLSDTLMGAITPKVDLDAHGEISFRFTSVFAGMIPKDVKERIKFARKEFGKSIYVLAEANNWKGEEVPIGDPLVIGIINDTCFLLDEFDCSLAEERILSRLSGGYGGKK